MPWRWLGLIVVVAACTDDHVAREPAPPADRDLAWYRVAMTGGDASEVAILLGVPKDPMGKQAVVVSGTERTVARVARSRATVRLEFPSYSAALVLEPASGGAYTGRYEIASRAWGSGRLPLRATPIPGPTLTAQATLTGGAPLDLGAPRTIWRMQLGENAVKLVVDQRAPANFEATMYFDNGNIVYLGGNGRGDRVLLTGFDGASAYSLDLMVDAARTRASGMWRAGHQLDWKEAIAGPRSDDFELGATIALENADAHLRHPLLEKLDGKPAIVELGASWCSTCKNVAPVLRELYRQHHGAGLEVITLLYELTNDPDANRHAETVFRELHGTTWTVRAVPGEQEDLIDVLPEGIVNVDLGGFPAVIFLRRDGTIAGIHSGFPAPATGEPYRAAVAKFQRLAAELMR